MLRCCFPRTHEGTDPGDGVRAYEAATDPDPDPPPGAEGTLPAGQAGAAGHRAYGGDGGDGGHAGAGAGARASDPRLTQQAPHAQHAQHAQACLRERPRSLHEAPACEAPDGARARVPLSRTLSQPAAPHTADELQRRCRRCAFDGSATLSLWSQASNGADSVFSSGSDTAASARAGAPESSTGHLDLSGMGWSDFMALPLDQIRALGHHCKRLTLPRGCTADTIRSWLRACPDVEEFTALDIQEDCRSLSFAQAQQLRFFRTIPPGPSTLYLGLKARAALPQDLAPPPDLDRLRGWVEAPETLPMLSDEAFSLVHKMVDRYVLSSAKEYRRGLWVTPSLQRFAPALMDAAPGELLSGADATNHAYVMKRLSEGLGQNIGYAELLNFVRPTLQACWDSVARPRGVSRYERRSRDELQALAALRHWVLSASPAESAGQREWVAASVRRSDFWSDPEWRSRFIKAAPQGREQLLEDGSFPPPLP